MKKTLFCKITIMLSIALSLGSCANNSSSSYISSSEETITTSSVTTNKVIEVGTDNEFIYSNEIYVTYKDNKNESFVQLSPLIPLKYDDDGITLNVQLKFANFNTYYPDYYDVCIMLFADGKLLDYTTENDSTPSTTKNIAVKSSGGDIMLHIPLKEISKEKTMVYIMLDGLHGFIPQNKFEEVPSIVGFGFPVRKADSTVADGETVDDIKYADEDDYIEGAIASNNTDQKASTVDIGLEYGYKSGYYITQHHFNDETIVKRGTGDSIYLKASFGTDNDHDYYVMMFANGEPFAAFDGDYIMKVNTQNAKRLLNYKINPELLPQNAGVYAFQAVFIPVADEIPTPEDFDTDEFSQNSEIIVTTTRRVVVE